MSEPRGSEYRDELLPHLRREEFVSEFPRSEFFLWWRFAQCGLKGTSSTPVGEFSLGIDAARQQGVAIGVDGDCVAVGFTWVGHSTTGNFDGMGIKP